MSRKCFVCGTESRQAEIGIRGIGSPADLDLRPSGAYRSSIYVWMQRCLSCGYCAPDIDKGEEIYKTIVRSPEYRKKIASSKHHDVINAFQCWSLLCVEAGHYSRAGWAALNAAWLCDDDAASGKRTARTFREQALFLFKKARAQGKTIARSPAEDIMVLIDIQRRLGLFKEAMQTVDEELKKPCDKKLGHILTFQKELIEDKDHSLHTIEEAMEDTDW